MASTSSLGAWLDAARFAHKVEFRRMACGGRWHLCRGAATGGALVLPEHEIADHAVIVRNVQAMTADTMICRAQSELTR